MTEGMELEKTKRVLYYPQKEVEGMRHPAWQ
jgi:hypothetical protein